MGLSNPATKTGWFYRGLLRELNFVKLQILGGFVPKFLDGIILEIGLDHGCPAFSSKPIESLRIGV